MCNIKQYLQNLIGDGKINEPKEGMFTTQFKGDSGAWGLIVQEDEHMAFMLCSLLTNVPKDKRDVMLKYINGANFGLKVGAFELDMEDGEFRYRIGRIISDQPLTEHEFQNTTAVLFTTFDKYAVGVLQVMGGQDYKEVLKEVESKPIKTPQQCQCTKCRKKRGEINNMADAIATGLDEFLTDLDTAAESAEKAREENTDMSDAFLDVLNIADAPDQLEGGADTNSLTKHDRFNDN